MFSVSISLILNKHKYICILDCAKIVFSVISLVHVMQKESVSKRVVYIPFEVAQQFIHTSLNVYVNMLCSKFSQSKLQKF